MSRYYFRISEAMRSSSAPAVLNSSPFAVWFGKASSGRERQPEQKVVTAEPVMLDLELWTAAGAGSSPAAPVYGLCPMSAWRALDYCASTEPKRVNSALR